MLATTSEFVFVYRSITPKHCNTPYNTQEYCCFCNLWHKILITLVHFRVFYLTVIQACRCTYRSVAKEIRLGNGISHRSESQTYRRSSLDIAKFYNFRNKRLSTQSYMPLKYKHSFQNLALDFRIKVDNTISYES